MIKIKKIKRKIVKDQKGRLFILRPIHDSEIEIVLSLMKKQDDERERDIGIRGRRKPEDLIKHPVIAAVRNNTICAISVMKIFNNIGISCGTYVIPEYRGFGLGYMIVHRAVELLFENGCKTVRGEIFEGNTSVEKACTKIGFKCKGWWPGSKIWRRWAVSKDEFKPLVYLKMPEL